MTTALELEDLTRQALFEAYLTAKDHFAWAAVRRAPAAEQRAKKAVLLGAHDAWADYRNRVTDRWASTPEGIAAIAAFRAAQGKEP